MPSQREGYAQKTTLVGIRVAMTKTRRANPLIIILEQTYNSRKRPPCFLILAGVPAGGRSRAPSPPRVRVSLSVVLGQFILESLVTQIP